MRLPVGRLVQVVQGAVAEHSAGTWALGEIHNEEDRPILFAGSQLGETRHVCAFFSSDEERYRVLLPFIKDGFDAGDKAVHVVNPDQHEAHLSRLAAAGIDTTTARECGQLEVRTNTETYLRRAFRSGEDAGSR